MRILALCALTAVLTALAAAPASARAMKVGDLGPMTTREACMAQARTVLADYIDQHGGQSVTEDTATPENWSVYGWGLRPGSNDLVIICPIVTVQPNAFYAIHSDGPEGVRNADEAAARLEALWQASR